MGALDRAVLVGDTAIVARRRHAVMGAQLLIAPGEVLLGLTIEVAERCRQTVAAVLLRHPAQRPQRVLQAFRQRHEALAAEHDMGMLEARERQPEVIEPMTEPLTPIVMPSAPMSVKSDRPIRPGGCSWRKITSRWGPLRARHLAMRRSKVRRTPGAMAGSRRQISSKMATARTPGAASSIGAISLSHTPASGSGRRRPRGL